MHVDLMPILQYEILSDYGNLHNVVTNGYIIRKFYNNHINHKFRQITAIGT